LPGVSCLELPSRFADVVLCSEGAAAGGATIQAGSCAVIQDGCVFQASCAGGTVLTGSVSRTGVSFDQVLTALADAETPAGGGSPAFAKGDQVTHACTATLTGESLAGSCAAGAASRRGTSTSVCSVAARSDAEVPACSLLAPSADHLFTLDACELLRDGDGDEPGIGEPVCAFRQNNCIWEVNCGNHPLLTFGGRLSPGATKATWRLFSGTPCEASFDAQGKMTGRCTVPGEEACQLASKPPVPGGADCPAVPEGTAFHSRGCGGGDPLDCRAAMQHGCNFMAICQFARFPDVVIAGQASYENARGHLAFNGAADYQCQVDQATDAEIESGDREWNEWYGQCVNTAGGTCRDNWNPETGTGYRGLQLFFEDDFPVLPEFVSLTGCNTVQVGPLCSLEQRGPAVTANCGGRALEGTIAKNGEVTLAAEPRTTPAGATQGLSCSGHYEGEQLTARCTQITSAVGDTPASELTCDATSDPEVLPDVTCMELPAELDGVVLCAEGGEVGATVQAGACKVMQDGCVFQAECANDVVITGNVSQQGVSFSRVFPALADAQTPASGGAPAFRKGDAVAHACTAAVGGGQLTGSCVAGRAGRTGTDTSVCSVSGGHTAQPVCDLLSPSAEHLFALDACGALSDGPEGIGEPVCAYRQTNCIWELSCGSDKEHTFRGRLTPGATEIAWQLEAETPCEATFDDAGKLVGQCAVPGQASCGLASLTPEPGGAACPALPEGTAFYSRGCGGGDPLDCRVSLQHGCDFMAICAFSTRFPNLVIAGEASYVEQRGHLEFNGAADYQCHVDQATEAEISSGDRQANEWHGQCVNAVGGMCRNNWNPETRTGYRGLQLFFE
jgi:hypothetical protein